MDLNLLLFLFVIVLLFGITFLLIRKKPKLSAQQFQKNSKKIEITKDLNPAHGILESHKIFITTLQLLFPNKKETAAKLISRIQKRLPNIAQIWKYHGLRNRAAHESGIHISTEQAKLVRENFIRALRALAK